VNALGLPQLGIGVGLRTPHYGEILGGSPDIGWFEAITDNFLDTEGRPLDVLDQVAARFPVVLHGVAMSIGSSDPLNLPYLRAVERLRARIGALWASDHLCWTGIHGKNSHDLLPLPYTRESLRWVANRVDAVQQCWGRPLILENPSTYVAFSHSTLSEPEFLAELCQQTGCGLLLDVNNVYVSSKNHGFNAEEYLAILPMDRVVQVHIAGHTHNGELLIDTHVGPVPDPVWALLAAAWKRGCRASVLLEWDSEIPPLTEVIAEAKRAVAILEST
jgi:uncharacterized protein (UPF0276 family)